MRILLFTIFALLAVSQITFSQRVLINESFESLTMTSDSLPIGWAMADVDGTNPSYPNAVWHARDTGTSFPGVNVLLKTEAHTGIRALSIPWRAGDPVADDWVWTPNFDVQTGDSLIFWTLSGQPVGINFGGLIDTMQVHVCLAQDPGVSAEKLITIRSDDSDNVFKEFSFSLNAYNGQNVCIGFRYFMNTTVDGLRVDLDDIFVGNRAAIGIHPISTNLPKFFDLRQNYPNPFNPVTNIEFSLPKGEFVSLKVYNELGQLVSDLVNEKLSAGVYKVDFNAASLPSGAYFYRITAGSFVKTNKMILTK